MSGGKMLVGSASTASNDRFGGNGNTVILSNSVLKTSTPGGVTGRSRLVLARPTIH